MDEFESFGDRFGDHVRNGAVAFSKAVDKKGIKEHRRRDLAFRFVR